MCTYILFISTTISVMYLSIPLIFTIKLLFDYHLLQNVHYNECIFSMPMFTVITLYNCINTKESM